MFWRRLLASRGDANRSSSKSFQFYELGEVIKGKNINLFFIKKLLFRHKHGSLFSSAPWIRFSRNPASGSLNSWIRIHNNGKKQWKNVSLPGSLSPFSCFPFSIARCPPPPPHNSNSHDFFFSSVNNFKHLTEHESMLLGPRLLYSF